MAYAGKVGERRPRLRVVQGSGREVGPIAAGVAVGLLLGAGVALLLAPQPGADVRRGLRRGLKRASLRTSDAWEDLRLELAHARRRLKRARRRTRHVVEDLEPIDD
jgi:gas vesicle protein